jgi:hypothetical protein
LPKQFARELRGLVFEAAQLAAEAIVGAGQLAQLSHARHELDDWTLESQDVGHVWADCDG